MLYSAKAVRLPAYGVPPPLESDTEQIVLPPFPPQPTVFSGLLTRALVRTLEKEGEQGLTYDEWFRRAAEPLPVNAEFVILGEGRDEPVFANRAARDRALAILTQLEQEPIRQAITSLSRLIEQREQQNDPYPEGKLNLGVAYIAMGNYEHGLPLLKHAVSLYTEPAVFARELERDPYAEAHYHDARYQLGRAMFTSRHDFGRAVSELKEAVRLDPENARAYYYLGQAIRAMVEHETLARAEEALEHYLAQGAPLGHEDEVREFLGSRNKQSLTR